MKSYTKRVPVRSRLLLEACRALPCQHSGVRDGTVVAAHSNWAEHGKGKGIKADDNRVAALCYAVHMELDQGTRWTRQERRQIWWDAHVKTVRELIRIGLWPLSVPVPDIRNFDA
jgi:hypothetical protein